MKKSIKTRIATKKNRLKRRSVKIFIEILKGLALIVTVLASASFMILAYNYMISAPYFQIEKTAIKGCERITEKEVLTLAGIKPFQNILAINPGEIARRINSNPWVKDVSIERGLPNRLVIEVRERKVSALVKEKRGIYFMDSSGVIIKKLKNGEKADVPILTGFHKNAALLKKSIELITCLSANSGSPEIRNVSEIHGDEIFGFSIFTDSGLCIQLGFGNYEKKLKRLKSVITDLRRKSLNKECICIDLSNPNRVVVKRKNSLKKGYKT
jgi:cell division protein FtsQ